MDIRWEPHYFVAFLAGLGLMLVVWNWLELRSGLRITGKVIREDLAYGAEGDRLLRPVVSYTVEGRTYEVTDRFKGRSPPSWLFGDGISPIGDEIVVRYPARYPGDGYVDHPVMFSAWRLVGA